MSAHSPNDQTLEIVFGVRLGDHIRLAVEGRNCPDAKDDWYRAQLKAETYIQVGEFKGCRSLAMFSDDFHRFRRGLGKLKSGESGVAALETSDFLSVHVSANGTNFDVWTQLDALERDGELMFLDDGDENWEWRLKIDRNSLDELIDAVAQVSDRYPTWSVPGQ